MDANNLSAFVSSVLSYELGGVSKALDAMSPKDVN